MASDDDTDAARGALLLIEKRSRIFGSYLVSLPYFDAAGPVGSTETTALLAEAAVTLARERGLSHVEIRSDTPLPLDVSGDCGKVRVRLDLAADSDALLAGFKKKLRSQVRRGLREIQNVRVGGSELTGAFFRIYSERMHDLGSPAHSRTVFDAILENFPDDARIVVLEADSAPIAAGLMLRVGSTAYLPWAATLKQGLPKSLNMALYFELFRAAIEWETSSFDLGRCDSEGPHLKFKLQWGGDVRPLYWYRLATEGTAEAGPSRDSPMMVRAAAVWRKLPLSWARALGPHVIRRLS